MYKQSIVSNMKKIDEEKLNEVKLENKMHNSDYEFKLRQEKEQKNNMISTGYLISRIKSMSNISEGAASRQIDDIFMSIFQLKFCDF